MINEEDKEIKEFTPIMNLSIDTFISLMDNRKQYNETMVDFSQSKNPELLTKALHVQSLITAAQILLIGICGGREDGTDFAHDMESTVSAKYKEFEEQIIDRVMKTSMISNRENDLLTCMENYTK